MPTIDQVVSGYRQLRDKKKEIEDQHKAELAPIKEKMVKLENYLQNQLNEAGVESMRTAHGTVYQSKRSSVKVLDWEETLKFIQENDCFHMLEKRLAKSSVEEFVEAQGHNVPGTDISYISTVNIRKN